MKSLGLTCSVSGGSRGKVLPSMVSGAFRLPCFLGSFEFNSHCCISVPCMCVILGVDIFFHERRPTAYMCLLNCGPPLCSLVTGKCEHKTNRGGVSLLAGPADCAVGFLPVKMPSGLLWRRRGVKFGLKMQDVTFSHHFTG